MENLRIIENQLLPVYQNDRQERLVDARELHGFVESKQEFSHWIKNRIEKYGFIENVDYTSFDKIIERETGATRRIEYVLTLDVAKEIAMVENNDRGRQARRYFIDIEKRYRLDTTQLSPELQMFKQIFDSVAAQQLELKQVKNDVQVIRDTFTVETKDDDWRQWVNSIIVKVGHKLGNYQQARTQTYEQLEDIARCDLNARLRNAKARGLEQGWSKSRIDKINKMDCIEQDPRIKSIYIDIVKRLAIKHGVS